jgi:hypothetical protein
MLIGTRPFAAWIDTANECAANWNVETNVRCSAMMIVTKISEPATSGERGI